MAQRQANTPYTAKEKLKALNLLQCSTIEFVAHRYHCSVRSVYRWKALYDGNLDSLENKSCRPLSPHPNSHTQEEIKHIRDMIRRNPHIGLNELYGKLRLDYAYTRNPVSLYRFLRKTGFYEDVKKRVAYKPKPYDTPVHIGEKMQMDVKFVPTDCFSNKFDGEQTRFYQYTIIDEATRERFIYPYQDLCADSTVDFLQRAIVYFGYKPTILQTDNGTEFTYTKQPKGAVHLLDRFCSEHGIEHKTIRPRTPRHNGKVERSHRNDNERFYKWLRFYSYDDLLSQMKVYLRRSNNIPSSVLKSSDGKTKWLTPKQKRKELLYLDWGVLE
ncbi:MAG: DDE-type integrase/transposase/recombinase [Clostridia bacterium]